MSYEGWKNWETWQLNLSLANEEPSYRFWLAEAIEQYRPRQSIKTATAALKRIMEDKLTAFLDTTTFKRLPHYVQDQLMQNMREIDWEELAEHWVRTAKEAD